MKIRSLVVALLLGLSLASPFAFSAEPCSNPLLDPSTLPHKAIAFDQIKFEHFKPAFQSALTQAKQRVEDIRNNSEEPTFANTIDALEKVTEPLDRVSSVFYNYLSVNSYPELEELAEEINPLLSDFSNSIFFDSVIFARVEKIFKKSASLSLSIEEQMLLKNTYRTFIRNGVALAPQEKARINEIDQRISVLGETFKKNVNIAVKTYELVITNEADLSGLPKEVIAGAAETAKEKGKEGAWVFTLQAPSYIPFIQYADSRSLREAIWRAYNTRASSGENDNRPLLLEIAKLRAERAKILGYKNHADYMTEDRMAGSGEKVEKFLEPLANAYRTAALKDLQELRDFAKTEDLSPWDISYYSEKLRQAKYEYSEEELRPYFSLERVIEGAFYAAGKLYGIHFRQRTDIPTWHPSVRVYEVVSNSDQSVLAVFFLDPFPRNSKRQGAWMNSIIDAGLFEGKLRIPHVINVGNFTPPVGNEPALLSYGDVSTVFHELGHGLHGMLTKVNYKSLSGTNVAWDFVELPSQLNENWATEPEVLDAYAKHYKTGERIPAELVSKVRRAANFQAGLVGLRQISLAKLDLAWHSKDIGSVETVEQVVAWEHAAMAPYRVIDAYGSIVSAAFSHIFSGGYSAGYYSYKWAEVLAADAFSVFEKNEVFDPETAARFRREILEKGGTEDPATLYRRFRQGEPDPNALLRKEGLIK